MARGRAPRKTEKKLAENAKVEATIHMAKYLKGKSFKRRAPHSVEIIRDFARKFMKTKDVYVDTKLNTECWKHGIKGVPRRLRIQMVRKRGTEEGDANTLHTVVYLVPVSKAQGFKGLQTTVLDQ
eukprot:NODE_1137_length_1558_cov_520.163685_g940_i0.p5 GENE.NODE_1137_length_1558_cov_520.163685_g940_i0~~NODE_1137_length_1558_cov_520.163685_g940_i0.p5  ORF type:complete len:125 (-),score=56.43 NODE_1137_length_1558_cov_520.163685_g940_i0:826-1200(-)